jgi:hypothetical protein
MTVTLQFEFLQFVFLASGILTLAAFQSEGRILARSDSAPGWFHARSLSSLVKARVFGITPFLHT